MSKLTRVIQKIFGETAGTGEFGIFGSNAASPPGTNSKDLTAIQSLSQYLAGWFSATASAAEPPRIEDRNSLDLLFSSQLKYLFQNGLAEWLDDADQLYYADVSFVTRSGSIYQAILGDDASNINAEKDPLTEPLWWRLVSQLETAVPWDVAEAVDYETAGFIVERFGQHYAASGKASNLGKDPADPQSDTWWIPSEGWNNYKKFASKGESIPGGMHPWTDFSSGDYQQNIKLDEIVRGGVTYDVFGVILDGTVVTGDGTLEAIFDPGGAKEYPWIDEFLPDNVGTRTLIDMRGRSTAAVGGVHPTLAEVKQDQLQGHRHTLHGFGPTGDVNSLTGGESLAGGATGAWLKDDGSVNQQLSVSSIQDPITDGVNSTPRTGANTHGKLLVRGLDYIIIIIAQ